MQCVLFPVHRPFALPCFVDWLTGWPTVLKKGCIFQFADVATGSSFIDGRKGFVQVLVIGCVVNTTFDCSDFLISIVCGIEFHAVGFGTYLHCFLSGFGLWSSWLP